MSPLRVLVLLSPAWVLGLNCGGGQTGSCQVGSESCACYPNLTCDAGLDCLSKVCVDLGGGGQAGAGGCEPDQADCSGACVVLASDEGNCGECGNACGIGEACAAGECACQPGREACDDACVDTTSNPDHCGGCAQACGPIEVCSESECGTSCAAGTMPCGRACVHVDADVEHCGACDSACSAGEICSVGNCQCPQDQERCGTDCVPSGSCGTGGAGGTSGAAGSAGAGGAETGGAAGTAGAGGAGGSSGESGGSGAGGSAGATGIVFFDDFEDMNTVGWTLEEPLSEFAVVLDGSYGLSINSGNQSESSVALLPGSWTDLVVEARVKIVSTAEGAQLGGFIGLRAGGPTAHYLFEIQGNLRLKIKRRDNIGGEISISPEYNDIPITLGTWYTLKFEAVGSTLNGYFNDSLVLTATDATYAQGGVVLGAQYTHVVFDDVKVTIP